MLETVLSHLMLFDREFKFLYFVQPKSLVLLFKVDIFAIEAGEMWLGIHCIQNSLFYVIKYLTFRTEKDNVLTSYSGRILPRTKLASVTANGPPTK